MKKFMDLAQECAGKEGATDDDVAEAMSYKMPSTPIGKCLHACIASAVGIVSLINFSNLNVRRNIFQTFQIKDNHVDIEATVEMAKSAYGTDEDQSKIVREISNECASITDADRCEATFKIMKCYEQAVKSRGLDVE